MLIKFIDKKKESWEDYLDTCVYAYNTSKHESSKYTLFEVMFGRRAVLPVDLNVAKRCGEPLEMESIDDELLESEMEGRQAQLESVKANILIAQQSKRNSTTASILNQKCIQLVLVCGRRTSPAKNVQVESLTENG